MEQAKLNTRNSSHVCWPCKTSADAIVRFANIKEDEDMLKIVCDDKLLEREFMVHDKYYREYTRLPKYEKVRCLKFHIKIANTRY